MAKEGRKKPQRRAQRKRKGILQQGENQNGQEKKFKATSSKSKEQEGCSKKKKFLCEDEGHEEEKHIKEDRKQPEEQDKQKPESLELLVHTHVLYIPELGVLLKVQNHEEEFSWEDAIPDVE